jgi:hypothetical protein
MTSVTDSYELRREVRCHDAIAIVATLAADPCSAMAHRLAARSRARHAKLLEQLGQTLETTMGPPPRLVVRSTTALYANHGPGWVDENSSVEPCEGTQLAASAERLA